MTGVHKGCFNEEGAETKRGIISLHHSSGGTLRQILSLGFHRGYELSDKNCQQSLSKRSKSQAVCYKKANSENSDLILHKNVRYISRRLVLRCFPACLEDTKNLMAGKGLAFPELTSDELQQKFYFMVDVTQRLNWLKKRQGEGKYSLVSSRRSLTFPNKALLVSQRF